MREKEVPVIDPSNTSIAEDTSKTPINLIYYDNTKQEYLVSNEAR